MRAAIMACKRPRQPLTCALWHVEANIFTFDTYDFVKRLIGAGMPEAQAEILAGEQ